MKRILFITCFLIGYISNLHCQPSELGILDIDKQEFYYTGINMLVWTHYDNRYNDNLNNVYVFNFGKQTIRTFYHNDYLLEQVKISRNGNYVGAISSKDKNDRELLIFDKKGDRLFSINELVRDYVFHPDSNKIIYMIGKGKYEGDNYEIDSEGIWLYDIIEKKKEKIVDKGWMLQSNDFDNILYFWDGNKIIAYDMILKNFEKTNHIREGMYSPNSKYYIYYLDAEENESWEAPYWSPFRIFDVVKKIDLSPEKIGYISERRPVYAFWSKDSKKIIYRGNVSKNNYQQMTYIYDIEQQRPLKIIDGDVVGYDNSKNTLVIFKNDKFALEMIP